MLFLDPTILQHGQVEIPQAATPVPAHILELLGDMDEIRATASKFFGNMHLWMPFISRKRFYELHLRSPIQPRPDIALLLLSLKLITTFPPTSPPNPRTALYHAAKHFYLEVEGSSIFSLPVLQAGVLIAMYELGHAIYPAAFLSIGGCAHYAHAIGINVAGKLNTRRVLTLVDVEERRRVYWAIVILDRFVSIGCPGRPFATADPQLDDLLPTEDAAWDQGIVRSGDAVTLSSPMTDHMSKFALLCQAARLLGQVLQHISSEADPLDDIWKQLDRTIQSMLTASLEVKVPDYDRISFVYSVLLALHAPWIHRDFGGAVDQERSLRAHFVLQQITGRIEQNLIERQCFLGRGPEGMSPWGLFFAYHICGAHIRSRRDASGPPEIVNHLKQGFRDLDVRWKAAGVYLQLLEAQEAMMSAA